MSQASQSPSTLPRKFNINPAALFLILGLIFGISYCISIPYGAGFDEEQHLVRIYDLASGSLLPNRDSTSGTVAFSDFMTLSYQRRFYQTPAFDLFTAEKFMKPLDKSITVGFPTRSIYSPVIFAPQAILARLLWRKYSSPVIPVTILLRLTGLSLYLAGTYFAIRWLPFGKWVMMALALSPMALFQASTVNADGFTNAASFMFISLTLNVSFHTEEPIRPWKAWGIFALCLLIGLAKPGTIVLLPLLLILPFKRFRSNALTALIWFGAALATLANVGWNFLSIPGSHFTDAGNMSVSQQLQLAMATPGQFIFTFVTANLRSLGDYIINWMGAYGHWVGAVPGIVYVLYPLVLLGALLLDRKPISISRKNRFLMAGVFLAGSGAIMMLYFISHYTAGDISTLGGQGRYFIFTTPLLFLSLAGVLTVQERLINHVKIITLSFLVVTLTLYSVGLFATYYTDCGSSYYTFQPCVQPIYKNLDIGSSEQAGVNSSSAVRQSYVSVCGRPSKVEVFIKSIPTDGRGTLTFSLFDHAGNSLSSKNYPVSMLQAGSKLSLAIASSPDPVGRNFEILLESRDVQSPQSFGIAYLDGNMYREGNLFIANKPVDGDLVFLYTCPSPWENNP